MALLNRSCRIEADVEGLDRSVVGLVAAAEEEHSIFLVGRFQRLQDAHGSCRNRGDFHEVESAVPMILCVASKGIHRCLRDGSEERLSALDPAHAASGEAVLRIDHRIEDQEDVPVLVGRQIDSEALEHFVPRGCLMVCEGLHTARAFAAAAGGNHHAN